MPDATGFSPDTATLGLASVPDPTSEGFAFDDRTSGYILDAQEAFGLLCQVVSQMAGLLVLDAAGARSGVLEHPMIERARCLVPAFDGLD